MIILMTAPKILTAKEWNAKKGVVAKLAGETGMGAALTKLEQAYAKVPWNVLDPNLAWSKVTSGKPPTADGLRGLLPAAKSSIGKVEPLRDELKSVRDLATALQKKWQASKVIPASSAAYAGQMAKEAETQFLSLKNFGELWSSEIKAVEQKEARLRIIALGAIKPYLVSLKSEGAAVLKEPTVEKYVGEAKTGFHQNIRGLNAALERSKDPMLMQWKEANWKSMSQDAFKPTKNDQVPAKVKQVLGKVAELEKLV